ncbi:MAG: hypothetical protein J5836_02220 [Clostridia bacterium]|nr:hypothetical protein [Clostridia bacterium]
MKTKNNKKRILMGAIVVSAALIVLAVAGFFLAEAKVFDVEPFKRMFIILTLGVGAVFTVYAVMTGGGYELAVGGVFLDIGVVILLIGLAKWYEIVIIAVAVSALLLLALMALKAKQLIIERTDEKEDYKPFKSYSE